MQLTDDYADIMFFDPMGGAGRELKASGRSAMDVPDDRRYTDQHEWLRLDGTSGTVGVTDYAQDALSDVTFVEAPEVGRTFAAGEEMGAIESCKAASAFYAPVACEVAEVNEALQDDPGLLNREPYEGGWIVKISVASPAEAEGLLTPAQYRELVEKEA